MKTSRNLWSQKEKDVLLKCVSESKNIKQGSKLAARILDRSQGACSVQYYSFFKKSKVRKFPVVENKENISNSTIDIKIENNNIFITKTVGNKVIKMEV